jgi:hypothetical protein
MTMSQKQVCQLDFDDYFTGVTFADESPLEPGVFLMPARTIDVAPPAIPEGKRAKWVGEWLYEDVPEITPEPTLAPELQAPTYRELRAAEYPSIGDQLDALFHAGVFPPEMAAQIQAVKNKYPKV